MTLSVSPSLSAQRWLEPSQAQIFAEILDLCALARRASDAQTLRLTHLAPALRMLQHEFVTAGIDCPPPDAAQDDQPVSSSIMRLHNPNSTNSDSVSVGVPVVDAEGLLAVVELHDARTDVMSGRQTQVLTLYGRLLAAQLRRLVALGVGVPAQMLALIEQVQDHDEAAASRVLTGLLHLAAGQSPSMVEVTALRIAGLAELVTNQVVLTIEGRNVLARAGISRLPTNGQATAQSLESAIAALPPARPLPSWTAFARLVVNEAEFDIAEAGEDEPLAFRATGANGDWAPLSHNLADGWPDIAAEVLSLTTDVVRHYAVMHMIRRRDVAVTEVAEIYDLHGLSWSIRPCETGHEICVLGQDWQPLRTEVDPSRLEGMDRTRERALCALTQLWPDLDERIGHDVRSWSRRMAAAAKVSPLMNSAA